MRPLTICLPYYMNPGMLAVQYQAIAALPDALREHLQLVIVDDGSPVHPAGSVLRFGLDVSVKIYRITVDVRWNQDAARNLAAAQAETDWLLLTDIDHIPTQAAFEFLMTAKLDEATVYRFGHRLDAPHLTPKIKHGCMHPHPNSWVMTKALYDRIGGYDEALAGNYGTDGDFTRRAKAEAALVELPIALVRYPREVVADASTTTLERKNLDDKARIRAIMKGRGEGWRPLRGSFPWERVA